MGFFRKKQSDVLADDNANEVVEAPKKKKNKKDMMSSILSESVVEAAVEAMKENKKFIAERNMKQVYFGLYLSADDIGGISKRSSRDEAKGQIVEQINSGRIATLITKEMLDNEELIIIPDEKTLEAMDEFGLLRDAPYVVSFVSDQAVEKTTIPITFEQVVEFSKSGGDFIDFLAEHGVPWAEDYKTIEEESMNEEDELETDMNEDDAPFGTDDDDEMSFDEGSFDEGEPEFDEGEDEMSTEIEMTVTDEDGFTDEVVADSSYDEAIETEETTEEEVSEEEFKKALIRKFYSDELGLEVTTAPFDAAFLATDTFIPFDENREDGWLNGYLNQMSKEANLELSRMHIANLSMTRERYYTLMSMYAEKIQRELDVKNPETQFGRLYNAIIDNRDARLENIDREVSNRKVSLNEHWEKNLRQVGEDASREAQQRYRERYGRKHDEDIFKVEPMVKQEIENDYENQMRQLHQDRRDEAAKRLDYAISETLAETSKMYAEYIEQEREAYVHHRDKIAAYLDDNRKEDIARVQALAEELRQVQKADVVMREQTEKYRQQAAEFETQRAGLRLEIEQIQRQTAEKIKEKDEECAARVARADERANTLKSDLDQLLSHFQNLDEKKKKEYESRITEMLSEKQSWEDKCGHIVSVHRKSNIIASTLAIVAVIAALAIGVVVGLNMNLDYSADKSKEAIVNEFNQRVDEIENKKHIDKNDLENGGGTGEKTDKETGDKVDRTKETPETTKSTETTQPSGQN